MKPPPNHTLLIGTTGMLDELTRTLSRHSRSCSLIARDLEKMRELAPGALHVSASWGDASFARALARAESVHGPVDLVVAWVHTGYDATWESLLEFIPAGATLFEVVGSAALDPTRPDPSHRVAALAAGIAHVRVALGYALGEGGRARWLTHAEISAGVLDAVARREDLVVGESSPWPFPL